MEDAKKSILVVDQSEIVRDLIQEALKQAIDCEVVLATGYKDALGLFRDRTFDLVILSKVMDDGDGRKLAQEMEAINPNIPKIGLSSNILGLNAEDSRLLSAYFVKEDPKALEKLIAKARELLGV